jgi:hypothetical protein
MLRLRSDQGSEFDAKLVRLMYATLGISFKTGSSYSPASQGKIESQNKTMKASLKKLLLDNGVSWDLQLSSVTFMMNIAPSSFRKLSAFEIVHGVTARMPMDLKMNLAKSEHLIQDELLEDAMEKHIVLKGNVHKEVHAYLTHAFQQHSNKLAEKYSKMKVEDLIWIKDQTREGLDPNYKGTYRVVEVGVNSYLVQRDNGTGEYLRSAGGMPNLAGVQQLSPKSNLGEVCKLVNIRFFLGEASHTSGFFCTT